MTVLIYDHSFEGFLTAVFEVYKLKLKDFEIVTELPSPTLLFSQQEVIATNPDKWQRIQKHIKKKITRKFYDMLFKIFIADINHKEKHLFSTFKYIIENEKNIEDDFTNEHILKTYQICRKIDKEAHRIEAFVRFEKKENFFISVIEPEFNILPLVKDHFVQRYISMNWIIFDQARKFGFMLEDKNEKYIFLEDFTNIHSNPNKQSATETFENLWKDYLHSVNIPERKNLKLQAQHMPKKYWKNMIEKKG